MFVNTDIYKYGRTKLHSNCDIIEELYMYSILILKIVLKGHETQRESEARHKEHSYMLSVDVCRIYLAKFDFKNMENLVKNIISKGFYRRNLLDYFRLKKRDGKARHGMAWHAN